MKIRQIAPFAALCGSVLAASLLAIIAGKATAAPPPAPQIWFTPMTWAISPITNQIDYSAHDFPTLIAPGAAWSKAASHIGVVSLPHNVVWSYPDRAAVVRFFQDHSFKTAFSFGMLFDDGLCPTGIEGVSHDHDFNHESVLVAQLWKAAGGNLDYVIMDAPLGYGHFLAPSCIHTIDDVARRAAATLNGIRAYFPNVRVVDAEGPARLSNPVWFAMMDEWLTAFKAHAGQPIDAVALDLHWVDLRVANSWQDTSQRSARFLHQRGVQTGLIVNDDKAGPSVTDASWMDANRGHITDVASGGGFGLDFLAIDSWMGHPRNNLPETDPSAYSSLVDFIVGAFP